jgi:DNA-binding NtrC family response regulator
VAIRAAKPVPRRILLVESDPAMAKVLERELGRVHRVLTVPTVSRALALLDQGRPVDVVVAAYRLRDGTAARLFDVVSRRWRHVRRVVLREADAPPPGRRLHVDSVVQTWSSFEDLLNAVQS